MQAFFTFLKKNLTIWGPKLNEPVVVVVTGVLKLNYFQQTDYLFARSAPKKCHVWCIWNNFFTKCSTLVKKLLPTIEVFGKQSKKVCPRLSDVICSLAIISVVCPFCGLGPSAPRCPLDILAATDHCPLLK